MKIIDCFTFYNEEKMLKFRLRELNDSVDYFVLVESTRSFSGKRKPLFFHENKDLFSKYLDKIIHVIVEDMPLSSEAHKVENGNAWSNEHHQRNCIDRGLSRLDISNNDIIMISDVDEIPDVNILKFLKQKEMKGLVAFKQDLYYYNLNCMDLNEWRCARAVDYKSYKSKFNSLAQKVRESVEINEEIKCGWHFSYCMKAEDISNKIKNFSHQEFNFPEYTNPQAIQEKIDLNKDPFGRNHQYTYVKIEENKYLPKHYKMLIDDE